MSQTGVRHCRPLQTQHHDVVEGMQVLQVLVAQVFVRELEIHFQRIALRSQVTHRAAQFFNTLDGFSRITRRAIGWRFGQHLLR